MPLHVIEKIGQLSGRLHYLFDTELAELVDGERSDGERVEAGEHQNESQQYFQFQNLLFLQQVENQTVQLRVDLLNVVFETISHRAHFSLRHEPRKEKRETPSAREQRADE